MTKFIKTVSYRGLLGHDIDEAFRYILSGGKIPRKSFKMPDLRPSSFFKELYSGNELISATHDAERLEIKRSEEGHIALIKQAVGKDKLGTIDTLLTSSVDEKIDMACAHDLFDKSEVAFLKERSIYISHIKDRFPSDDIIFSDAMHLVFSLKAMFHHLIPKLNHTDETIKSQWSNIAAGESVKTMLFTSFDPSDQLYYCFLFENQRLSPRGTIWRTMRSGGFLYHQRPACP